MRSNGQLQGMQGFALIEIVVVAAIFACLATVVMPRATNFYREAALEYETQHLLADIRRAQSLSRLLVESGWGYGSDTSYKQLVEIDIKPDAYTLSAQSIKGSEFLTHYYLPLVHVRRKDNSVGGKLSFDKNGGLTNKGTQMMTLVIYCEGQEEKKRRIMISKAGRIRLERGAW